MNIILHSNFSVHKKFYWNASNIICLCIICVGFHAVTTKLSSCNTNRMACKTKNIYHLGLYRRSLLTAA